jgi:nucleoside permease NupC
MSGARFEGYAFVIGTALVVQVILMLVALGKPAGRDMLKSLTATESTI